MEKIFTSIAPLYDRMNRTMSLGRDRRWRKRAIDLLDGPAQRILDLATGTGDVAFALAQKFPHALIRGEDLTPAMLDLARKRNTNPNITFITADARVPATDGNRFDLVTCAFGFRNFSDKFLALQNVRERLADNGRLLVLEFFRPSSRIFGKLPGLWIALTARLFTRGKTAAYDYLRKSIATACTAREFIDMAARAGFELEKHDFAFPSCRILLFKIRTDQRGAP